MVKFNCFCVPTGRTKINKVKEKAPVTLGDENRPSTLHIQVEGLAKSPEIDWKKSNSFDVPVPFSFPGSKRCNIRVMSHESPIGDAVEERAYQGEDEHDESLSIKRDNSDFDLPAKVANSDEVNYLQSGKHLAIHDSFTTDFIHQFDKRSEIEEGTETLRSGHISDPGVSKAEFWTSPKLVRSCSDLALRNASKKLACEMPRSNSPSFQNLHRSANKLNSGVSPGGSGSPISVMSHCSADKVMLKKHSSSQILPSRSRKLWWKLFLWSHRNQPRSGSTKQQVVPVKPALNQQGGYSSDILEPRGSLDSKKPISPCSSTGELFSKGDYNKDNKIWDGFDCSSGLWPQNQWVAFPSESSALTRVDQWVKELSEQSPVDIEIEDCVEDDSLIPASPGAVKSPARSSSILIRNLNTSVPEEILHANAVIQSLNSSSTVAHIVGAGLKVIPMMSGFSSLRSVNLSGNSIVHIAAGSLPKGLHVLNLSRNKISIIEGLRDLTRLRVLDLSYNRISRIGQGLSSCTAIKELYLSGNKISDVDGLHRLLKLTVLDLSFNKITTAKALGQLVANYISVLALNLVGNPIHSNISDEQLRKTVCSLLPKLAFLNKQAINPQKAREVGTEAIAKAALGSGSRSTRRKAVRRVNQGASSSASAQRSSTTAHRSRHRSRSHTHVQPSLKAN